MSRRRSETEHEHEHAGHEELDELAAERERAVRRQVAIAQIRQYGDPVLRMRAHEVDRFDEELERVAGQMVALMHDADGVGLAATQVGILRRLLVFSVGGEDRVVVNPALEQVGAELETSEEGCLSLGAVRVPVERSLAVTLEGRTVTGEPVELELEGLSARAVQHELDHLDGVLVIDRTDPESRREALAQLRPRLLLSR